jgi:SSS family solute:Na+ symporter
MVVFGIVRSEQSAWWNILAWTARNSATFAPVLAVLLWRGATRSAALAAMVAGFAAGMLWYELSGWGIANFAFGIHPVWMGMSINITVLMLVSLVTTQGWNLRSGIVRHAGVALLVCGISLGFIVYAAFGALQPTGLLGLILFSASLSLALGIMFLLRPLQSGAADNHVTAISPVQSSS